MTIARSYSVALVGLSGSIVEVEADISSNLPKIVLIGLPDAALGEARERVRAAAANSGCPLTDHRLTINLSPASLPKQGSGFDLAIALASLAAAGSVSAESVAAVVHLGELGLDGRLRPMAGVLPAVLAARSAGMRKVMVPAGNRQEAELVGGVTVIPVASLREAAIWHGGDYEPADVEAIAPVSVEVERPVAPELAEVVGHDDAVEALVVAAAGGHHVLLLGPPGAGKTMLAERLPGILPDLDDAAALEVTSIRSLCGSAVGGCLERRPPFEAPHHTATAAAIVGGGSTRIRPGAAVRASHGVLFLDEAPEFAASVLDVLRQPMESGSITIHRARHTARFPSRFQLVMAANPCPCGQYGAPDGECTCAPTVRRRYLARISGPLMDRVDVRLTMRCVTAAQLRLAGEQRRLTTEEARRRVGRARAAAAARLRDTEWNTNGEVSGTWLRDRARLHGRALTASIDRALERGTITMRGYDRVLRLAWTIADVAGRDAPVPDDVGTALYMRGGVPA